MKSTRDTSVQTGEQKEISPEDFDQKLSEVQDAILRMQTDATRKPARKPQGGGEYRNYLHQEIARTLSAGPDIEIDEFVIGSVATLVHFKIPELIVLHKLITKNAHLPQSSEEFLVPMDSAKRWMLDRSGVSAKDIEAAKEFFRPSEETNSPYKKWVYLLTQVVDVAQTGFGKTLDKGSRGMPITKDRLIGNLASTALKSYVHPGTLEVLEMGLRSS